MSENYVEAIKEFVSAAYNNGFQVGKDEGYQKGLEDAWECAKRIALTKIDNNCPNFTIAELEKIFGYSTLQNVFDAYSASEAIEKVKAYEEKKKADERIMFGDGLVTKHGDMKGIALSNEVNGGVYVWREDCVTYEANVKEWKKTGETYPQAYELLKKMKGGEE